MSTYNSLMKNCDILLLYYEKFDKKLVFQWQDTDIRFEPIIKKRDKGLEVQCNERSAITENKTKNGNNFPFAAELHRTLQNTNRKS